MASAAAAQDADRKGSPFEALRWRESTPEVEVRGTWYVPLEIEGVAVSEILAFCEKRWPGRQQKRFGEDLVEAMALMGHTVPSRARLVLQRVPDGKKVTLHDVEVTRENRERIRADGVVVLSVLTRAQAKADLVELKDRLEDQFAYFEAGDFKWKRALQKIERGLPKTMEAHELAHQLRRFMAGFIDGHAGVRAVGEPRPSAYPPFLLEEAHGGVVAFLPDRSGFVDAEFPYVAKIDGVSIDDWIDRAAEFIPAGSQHLVRMRALRDLRALEFLRRPKDRAKPDAIALTLQDARGRKKERTVAFTSRRPTYGPWPRGGSQIIEGDIGYLRIPRMDADRVDAMRSEMARFRKTRGLIVDVRGNGGGSRAHLIALAGYFVGPDEKPWVGNVAKYKTSSRFDRDHLEARFMYPADHERWSDAQRAAIKAFATSFEPEWKPKKRFSPWHYLVLDRTGHAEEYFYDKPVIVLTDAGCFSATDIFIAALRGRPRITILGTPSGGGSARSQGFTLPESGIEVRCASMASFQPDGSLYDGRGVDVDVRVEAEPESLLMGKPDTVLKAAVARLRE